MVEDENGNVANVTIADVDQSNGVIHVIDKLSPAENVALGLQGFTDGCHADKSHT